LNLKEGEVHSEGKSVGSLTLIQEAYYMQRFMSVFFKIVMFVSCFFVDCAAADSSFFNEYNHYSGSEIQKIRLIGERCSGTTYIQGLLANNFPSQHVVAPKKHFLPWFNLNAFNISKKSKKADDLNFLGTLTDSCLVVLVVRDPYDWLRSFYSHPWHVNGDKMLHKGFLNFLAHEWRASDKKKEYASDRWNPYKQRRFRNVLELRKYKTLNYLQIGIVSKNFLVVRYEDAAKNPQDFIHFISENFNMQSADQFTNVLTYKNENKKKYHATKYDSFKAEEFLFINKNIDWFTEKLIGYEKVEELRVINGRSVVK
jgi:hypothetical protein